MDAMRPLDRSAKGRGEKEKTLILSFSLTLDRLFSGRRIVYRLNLCSRIRLYFYDPTTKKMGLKGEKRNDISRCYCCHFYD